MRDQRRVSIPILFIYNVDLGEIEWEYVVEGDKINANPHIVRFLPEDIPEIGASRGSIMLADRNNRWSFVDRLTGRVQCKLALQDCKWAHDILLSKNRDGFIVTDYLAQFVGKIDFKGNDVWRHKDFGPMRSCQLSKVPQPAEYIRIASAANTWL